MPRRFCTVQCRGGGTGGACGAITPPIFSSSLTASQKKIHPLITKPYVNEVTLRGQKPPLKCC